jgi:hypothetical protein
MSFAKRLVSLLLLIAPCVPAFGADYLADDYEIGTNLFCDTKAQAERFVTLFAGDAEAAVVAVNAEVQNPTACALMDVAFMRGSQVGTVRHGDNTFEIVRILVVGLSTASGVKPVRPAAYFSLFSIKEYGV